VLNLEPETWNLELNTGEVAVKSAWMRSWCLLAAAVTLSGCAKFDLRKNIPWGEGLDGRIEQPMRVEAVWVDTILTKPDQKPIRGFGGRLYFFGPNNSQESTKVEGTLVIYGFEETNRDPTNVVPDRKVVYPQKEFEALYSKSKLGHSYSVWVPWDEAGGTRKEITLLARFIPKKGAVIASEQIKVLLPGLDPQVDVRNVHSSQSGEPPKLYSQTNGNNVPGAVQQASFQQPVATDAAPSTPGSESKSAISSYTIPLHGDQARYFIQRPTYSGGALVGTVDPQTGSGPTLNNTIAKPAAMSAAQAQPLPQSALPQPAAQATPSQTPPMSTQPRLPVRRSTRFEHLKHPAQAGQAARLSFERAPWGQHRAESPSGPTSSPSQGTTHPHHGSPPTAGQQSTPGQIGYAPGLRSQG
jgi:hypothetical protein